MPDLDLTRTPRVGHDHYCAPGDHAYRHGEPCGRPYVEPCGAHSDTRGAEAGG